MYKNNLNILNLLPVIQKSEVLRYLKINIRKHNITDEIDKLIDYYISYSKAIMNCYTAYRIINIVNIDDNTGVVTIENSSVITSTNLANFLYGSNQLVFLIASIGKGVPDEIDELSAQNKITDSLILDAVGSTAVESIMDRLNYLIWQEQHNNHRFITKRYSPGYGDWDLSDQALILDVTNNSKAPVSLTKSNLLVPYKSVSAVLGIVPEENISKNSHICDENCKNRLYKNIYDL